ncbi:hypothetical protein M099_4239 [Phocaeicola vulgatus str. 3975 RP4]|jgi:hypothetical protein|uniref:Uncharacterized protein n=1 Tax=Phocaeicola vulgatus str. 3975 RP4 TaxID=1339352 RepID=A0A069S2K7_PHOVU|nr:hypothetical protein M099_4239 [Phocaeicola vulgatus str. 3975 RP4]
MDIAESHLRYMADTDATTGIDFAIGIDDDILEEVFAGCFLFGIHKPHFEMS